MDASQTPPPALGYRNYVLIVLLSCTLTAILYGQTFAHDFVYFDDDGYVLNHTMVRAGLSLDGLKWAFQSLDMANWHPLTWVSYMLDASLFGIESGWFLLHNALLHAVNGLLVFTILWRLGRHIPSALFGSVVFVVHPLHVESVAWIAERKDVLSGLFYLLGLVVYLKWMDERDWPRYFAVIVLCALALMAKPMAVSFPLVLILFDLFLAQRKPVGAVLEKAPLFLMCLGAGIATLLAQGDSGAVSGFDIHSVELRLSNTVIGYTTYLRQFLVPTELAAFYSLNDEPRLVRVAASGAVVCLMLIGVVLGRNRYKFVSLGIGFFLVSLLPVIGLMQVGMQAHADRYMYLPLLGLLIACLEIPRVFSRERLRLVGFTSVVWTCLLAVLCFWQIGYWENRGMLFNRILSVNGPVYIAHVQMADHYRDKAAYDKATSHALKALEMEPERISAQIALGDIALQIGDLASAENWYMEAVSMSQESPLLLNKVGVSWAMQGRQEAAVGLFQRALEISPHNYEVLKNLHRYESQK